MTPWFIFVLILSLVGVFPIVKKFPKIVAVFDEKPVLNLIKRVSLLALLVFCMVRISSGAYNPFIYFRF